MSKRTILIAIVIILAATAWYFTDKRDSVVSSKDFIINDTSTVDKIILEKDNQILKLVKVEGEWMVNDTFQVNRALVKRVFRVFINLNLVAPISNNSGDSIIESLKKSGMKISVFSGNGCEGGITRPTEEKTRSCSSNVEREQEYLYLKHSASPVRS